MPTGGGQTLSNVRTLRRARLSTSMHSCTSGGLEHFLIETLSARQAAVALLWSETEVYPVNMGFAIGRLVMRCFERYAV